MTGCSDASEQNGQEEERRLPGEAGKARNARAGRFLGDVRKLREATSLELMQQGAASGAERAI
jgi:hypothetical protein